jgi:ApaG protein
MTKKYAVAISVKTAFLEDQTKPDESRFAFSYTVTITNVGSIAAQLISRHWIIKNDLNEIQEVKGLGVIGAQPLLQPNESFEYTSGTVLTTHSGEMKGTYQMVAADGTLFEAVIEPFRLTQPRVLH